MILDYFRYDAGRDLKFIIQGIYAALLIGESVLKLSMAHTKNFAFLNFKKIFFKSFLGTDFGNITFSLGSLILIP